MGYILRPPRVDEVEVEVEVPTPVALELVYAIDFTTHAPTSLASGDTGYTLTGVDGDGNAAADTWTLTGSANCSSVAISSAGLRYTACTGNVYLEAVLGDLAPSVLDGDRFVAFLKLDDNPSDAAHQLVWRLGNSGNTYAFEGQRKYSGGKIFGYRRRDNSTNTDTNTGVVAGPFTCLALEWTRHGVTFWRGTWADPFPELSTLTRQIDAGFNLTGAVAWPFSRATDKFTLRAIGGATTLTATFEKIVIARQASEPS
jgi:hypothetical protein